MSLASAHAKKTKWRAGTKACRCVLRAGLGRGGKTRQRAMPNSMGGFVSDFDSLFFNLLLFCVVFLFCFFSI